MSRATVELDFFGMERDTSSETQFQRFLHRRRSFKGIQGAISKINPEVIKSVIASGGVNQSHENGSNVDSLSKKTSVSVPSSPMKDQPQFTDLPVYAPISRHGSEKVTETTPLTIFYNGMVTVFDVPRDKAECILKVAVEGCSKKVESTNSNTTNSSSEQQKLLETLSGDLPIARKKSLERFLEKRKERLMSVSPYACLT